MRADCGDVRVRRKGRVKNHHPVARKASRAAASARARVDDAGMVDVILLAIIVAFFALAVLFVKACERIIGPDVESQRVDTDVDEDRAAA